MGRFGGTVSVLVLTSIVGAALHARAGNDDEILIGAEASLTGGAVTATSSDGAAVWYNPAGIASSTASTLDVSGSAFVLRAYSTLGVLTSSTGQRASGSFVEVVSVPSALTFVRPLGPNLVAGVGVFVTHSNDITVRAALDMPGPGDQETHWLLAVHDKNTLYHAGPALAWRPLRTLRLGVALLAVYGSESTSFQFAGGVIDPMTYAASADGAQAALSSQSVLGVRATLGAQWDPAPWISLGLSASSPSYAFWRSTSARSFVVAYDGLVPGDSRAGFAPGNQESAELGWAGFAPARVRAGVAVRFDRGWLALDGDVQPAMHDDELGVARRVTWNARLGGRLRVGEQTWLGAGLFTDRSPFSTEDRFGALRADFYGGSLGIEYGKTRHLRDDPDAQSLTFTTSIALRYAYGSGTLGGLVVMPFARDGEAARAERVHIGIHELALNLGSAFYF